jgi:hypothetical protein
MVVLLGVTALVVDVGLMYSERAQLQNSADAAAIAVAQKCARDLASSDCSPTSPVASELTNGNALDSLSNVTAVAINATARRATVTTSAKEAGGVPNSVSLHLANIFGMPSAEVGARASAEWGSPISGPTVFPLTVSICQVQNRVEGEPQLIQMRGTQVGNRDANPGCNFGPPSSLNVPGGFGWLAQDPGQCGALIDLNTAESGSDTGNNGPPNCLTVYRAWIAELNAGGKPTLFLPVFHQVTGTGGGAIYQLKHFAAFEVWGWKFSGGNESDDPSTVFRNTSSINALDCRGDCRGIIGKFVKYASLREGYLMGPTNPYGATIVQMTAD